MVDDQAGVAVFKLHFISLLRSTQHLVEALLDINSISRRSLPCYQLLAFVK